MSLTRLLTSAALLLIATAAQAQTGTISGTITTATTVTSSVTLYTANGQSPAGTSANGSYSFTGLAPGTYYVKVSAPSYVTELFDDISCMAEDCVVTDGTPILVTSEATATANVTLVPGGGIQGTVRRASDSTPVGNVTVFLYNASTSFVQSVVTAADGTYAFSISLPAGNYYVRVGAPSIPGAYDYVQELYGGVLCPVVGSSFHCRIAEGTPVAVAAGTIASGIDFSLDPGARFTGQVVTPDGVGVPNVTVTAYTGLVTPLGSPGMTDANGFYTVLGLPGGIFFLRATPPPSSGFVERWLLGGPVASPGASPGALLIAPGDTRAVPSIHLTVGGALSGTMTFTDPLAGMVGANVPPVIEVYNAAGALVATKALFGSSPVSYTVDGLPTGTYYVKAASTAATGRPSPPAGRFVDQLYRGVVCVAEDCAPTSGTPVSVTAGASTTGIDFALEYGGSITGTVAAGTFVDLYDSRGVRVPRRTVRNALTTGLIPGFHAVGLPAGTYYLVARRNEFAGIASELYRGHPCEGCAVTFGTPVVVRGGAETTNVNFAGVTGGTIAGTVRDESSAPLSTITVEVYTATGTLAAAVSTSFAGAYRTGALASGTYYVRTVNLRGYADEAFDNIACAGCGVLGGTAVTVAASATTTVNFALAPGVPVGGIVKDSLNNPLEGTSVSLFTSSGTPAGRATADAFGSYAVTLTPGSYRARTDPKPGYMQELYNNLHCTLGTCDVTTGTPIAAAAAPVTNVDFALDTCSAFTVSPVTLATAAVGAPYRQTILAFGFIATRRFAVTSGTLPPGLALDPSGVISGTPTTSGRFTFTIAVTGGFGCVQLREYTLDVPACAFTLAGTSASLRARGEPWLIRITNACGTVTAVSNDSWITINESTSTHVVITAAPNTAETPRTGTVTIGPRVFTVFQSGTANAAPFGVVDTPIEGTAASGSIAVGGWALDDLGINRVLIYRDPVGSEPSGALVFVGQATFVTGARPDVEGVYPAYPFVERAGWGYLLLTNMLPNQGNGTFRLSIFAEDADLTTTLLATRTIVVNNAAATAPFGAIDTPAQGATVSGSAYTNFGWVLTPQPKLMPFDGSTISVYIDGAPIGPLTQYNFFRSDVSGLFPGLKNSGGPVGFRTIDTTALTEGVHTLSWIAFDDAGVGSGIGSRYFTVNNSAWQPALTQGSAVEPAQGMMVPPRVAGIDVGRRSANLSLLPAADAAVSIRRDREGVELEVVDPTETGLHVVTIKALERVELEIGSAGACTAAYAGYLTANGQVRDLPLGASLDASGRFYWQTTPGFIGNYRIVFVRTACDGTRERIPVVIRIAPK